MKGKIAFVVGAAVGYVLGSRAGRERYEQIKRGAESLWQTEPVQRGVDAVRGVLDDRADELKLFIRRASSDVFANLAKHTADRPSQGAPARSGSSAENKAAAGETGTGRAPETKAAAKPGAKAATKAKPKPAAKAKPATRSKPKADQVEDS